MGFPCLSFPRRRESGSCVGLSLKPSFHSSCGGAGQLRKQSFHSTCGRAGHFSLGGQRKVTKRKATPRTRSTGILPSDFARGLRGSQTAHPCADCERGAIHRAAPAGFSSAREPRPKGPQEQRTFHVRRGKANSNSNSNSKAQSNSNGSSAPPRSVAFASAHMDCALLSGPVRVRRAYGGNVAQRSRARCARVCSQYRDVLSANPVVRSRSRRAGCP